MRRGPWALPLALALGACATAGRPGSMETAPGPVAEAPVPAQPGMTIPATPAPAPTARERLVARHRERAEQLERDGALRRALDEWKIALTIAPADTAARTGRAGLEARIEGLIAERVTAGRAALARGSQVEARRRFLSALALDPANRVAFEALQSEVREVEFLTHTVRAGETLASIAQHFYGDRSRLEVIWETNQLPPNPRLVAGTVLKIPEIPGLPFPRREVPPLAAPRPDATPATPAKPEVGREEPPEVDPLLVEVREAVERSDYVVALADVDRYLSSNPGNRDALDLKKQALYGQGKAQLEQKKYDESFRALTQLAKLQPDYEDTAKLLQQARLRVVERHYSEGIRLFREEKLKEAVAQWRIVLELDPQHVNARRNVEQAERLLRGLDERKRR